MPTVVILRFRFGEFPGLVHFQAAVLLPELLSLEEFISGFRQPSDVPQQHTKLIMLPGESGTTGANIRRPFPPIARRGR